MSSSKEQKHKLNPKTQQIIDIVVTAIEALVVVICIVVSVVTWVGVSDPADRSINWFAVQTDSMMGNGELNFDPGDLVFTKRPQSQDEIEVGTVIAFKAQVQGTDGKFSEQILIHRVVSKETSISYRTRGDNTSGEDPRLASYNDIVGVYHGKKVSGLGKVVLWLGGFKKVTTQSGATIDPNLLGGYGYEQSGNTSTFLVIIIPLALLFIYNGYVVAKWVLDERAKKIKAAALAEAQAGAAANAADEATIKRAALVEFMKAQGMTEEQIEAYFAAQDSAAKEADEQAVEEADSAVEVAQEAEPANEEQEGKQEE